MTGSSDTLKPDLAETGAVEEQAPPRAEAETEGRATFRVWRGDRSGGRLVDYTTALFQRIPHLIG